MPTPCSDNDFDSDADFDWLSQYEAPSVDEKTMTLMHRIQTARDGGQRLSPIASLAIDRSDRPLSAALGIDGVWAELTVPAHAIQTLIRNHR